VSGIASRSTRILLRIALALPVYTNVSGNQLVAGVLLKLNAAWRF
jgi:hypothetical protein